MATLRFITVFLTCFTLAFPVSALAPCCCTRINAAHVTELEASASEPEHTTSVGCQSDAQPTKACCHKRTVTEERSCSKVPLSGSCERTCECSLQSAGNAVRSAVQMDREVAAVAWLDFEFPFEAQLFSATSGSRIQRPPISHNRRQAALCVWQN
jgi:hypothetical protein